MHSDGGHLKFLLYRFRERSKPGAFAAMGPAYVRAGRAIRYRRSDLVAWIDASTWSKQNFAGCRSLIRLLGRLDACPSTIVIGASTMARVCQRSTTQIAD